MNFWHFVLDNLNIFIAGNTLSCDHSRKFKRIHFFILISLILRSLVSTACCDQVMLCRKSYISSSLHWRAFCVPEAIHHHILKFCTKYLRQNLVSMWNSTLREKFNFAVLTKFSFSLCGDYNSIKIWDFTDIS